VISSRLVEALAEAGLAGPYFAIETPLARDGWRSFADLLDPDVLAENVAGVQTVLAERTRLPVAELDLRACASTHFLGLASRLLAPALGTAAIAGVVPVLTVGSLGWQRVSGGPIPMALFEASEAGGTQLAPAIFDAVIDPVLRPLAEAFEQTFQLSPQVLWGNVGSALAGAAGMLNRTTATTTHDPVEIAVALGRIGPLRDMGSWDQPDPNDARRFFVRNNCCLFYKIPGGGTCGDCVLIAPETRTAMWRDALSGPE
jgi:hypothetical protein